MTFQLMLFPDFKEKAVTFSYDDGTRHDIRLIEIFSKYGLKGTFNLNSGCVEGENRVHPDEFQKVYLDTGNEIAVHGVKHLSLPSIPDERIVEEIFSDRKALEGMTGKIVNGMAYANGAYDDRVIQVLKTCGILYARTVEETGKFAICDDWLRLPATCHHACPQLFELAEQFLSEEKNRYFWANAPKLFYVWGHSYEFALDDSWERMEKFCATIGGKENVWYATNGEIVRYVEAYKRLAFSADGSKVHNPTALDVYIQTPEQKKFVVPAGKTIAL